MLFSKKHKHELLTSEKHKHVANGKFI